MPLLNDPREFITSQPLVAGYRADQGCDPSRWVNLTDASVRTLLQSSAGLQPTVARQAEIGAAAVVFTNDTMGVFGAEAGLATRKSRYLRMIVRLDAWGGSARGLFGTGGEAIETSTASPNLRLNNGITQVNEVAMPLASFRRVDAVFSVAAADTFLRAGSVVAAGGTCIPRNSSGASSGFIGFCGDNQRPDIAVAEAWLVNGRPTDRELASWDACDAARYGSVVLS